MRDNRIELKKAITLHQLETDKFKTNLCAIFLSTPLKRETITLNALLPMVLRRGSEKNQTQEEISKNLEEMYGADFDCGIEKSGNNQILKFYLESLNDEFTDRKEDILKESLELLIDISNILFFIISFFFPIFISLLFSLVYFPSAFSVNK